MNFSGSFPEGLSVKQRHFGLEQMYAARFLTVSLTFGLKSSLSIYPSLYLSIGGLARLICEYEESALAACWGILCRICVVSPYPDPTNKITDLPWDRSPDRGRPSILYATLLGELRLLSRLQRCYTPIHAAIAFIPSIVPSGKLRPSVSYLSHPTISDTVEGNATPALSTPPRQ
jgi:hypothetical protein